MAVVAIVFVIVIFTVIPRSNRDLARYFGYTVTRRIRLLPEHIAILEKHFPYYHKLTARKKALFQKRLRYFIGSKVFIPKQMEKYTRGK